MCTDQTKPGTTLSAAFMTIAHSCWSFPRSAVCFTAAAVQKVSLTGESFEDWPSDDERELNDIVITF